MEIKFKHLIVPIILVIALAIGVIFYQKQNQDTQNNNTAKSDLGNQSGIVLGDSNSDNTSTSISQNTPQITSGTDYTAQINSIRNGIIQDVNELNSRMKYKTVFNDGAIVSYANEVLKKNQSGIDQIKVLNIDPKFSEANKKNIESLDKITESLMALKKSYTVEDKTEAQKQKELYAYNLEQSDSIYKGIQVPK